MTDQENNNSISGNPFAALFGSLADAKLFAAAQRHRQRAGGPEEPAGSQDDSDNSVSESLDDGDCSVAEISRSFRSQRELCEQLNTNHMIQRIFLITLDNSECGAAGRGRRAGRGLHRAGPNGRSVLPAGDPSMKSGNGIPARCVYLEEMAADLDEQDWLDMNNVEQVGRAAGALLSPLAAIGLISPSCVLSAACLPKCSLELPFRPCWKQPRGFGERGGERLRLCCSCSSCWRPQRFAGARRGVGHSSVFQ